MATEREKLEAIKTLFSIAGPSNRPLLVPPQMDEGTARRWQELSRETDFMANLREAMGVSPGTDISKVRTTDAQIREAREKTNRAVRERNNLVNRFEKPRDVLDRVSQSVLSGDIQALRGEELLMAAGPPQGLRSGVWAKDVLQRQVQQLEQNLPQEIQQTPGRLASPLPEAQGAADTSNQQQGGQAVNPTERILRDLSSGVLTPQQATQALVAVGFTQGTAQTRVNAVVGGQDPQFPSPTQQTGATQPPTTQAQQGFPAAPGAFTPPTPGQAGAAAGNITGVVGAQQQPPAQQPTGSATPTAQTVPVVPAHLREQANQIFNEARGGLINPDEAINRLANLMGDMTLAQQVFNQEFPTGVGGTTIAELLGQGLGTPDFMQQRGLGDVSRRFALESGVAPNFRDFMQQQAQRQAQLAFPLQAAMGTAPGTSGMAFTDAVTSPQAFEQFLAQGQVPSGMGQSLRQAADFLRGGGQGALGGREAIEQMLMGPSGSVGSEMFSPTIGMALQNAGRRFLPGLGQAARYGTSAALENMFARDPMRFQSAPEFIDFLAQQRVI